MQKNENCDSIYIAFKNKLNKQTKKNAVSKDI